MHSILPSLRTLLFMVIATMSMSSLAETISPYGTIRTTQNSGILRATILNNSTNTNLYDSRVHFDLVDLVSSLQGNSSIKVVIFSSGNPDFFLNHLDVMNRPGPPFVNNDPASQASQLFQNISLLPIATIAVISGRSRAVGNEFLLSLDMRFATKHGTLLGQPEVGLGLVPGAGGAQLLSRLIGRGLAMEHILVATDVDAEEAERIGWINKAFECKEDMVSYVDDVAKRIALWPKDAIKAAKEQVNRATLPASQDLVKDSELFNALYTSSFVAEIVPKVLVATANETVGRFELNFGEELPRLYD